MLVRPGRWLMLVDLPWVCHCHCHWWRVHLHQCPQANLAWQNAISIVTFNIKTAQMVEIDLIQVTRVGASLHSHGSPLTCAVCDELVGYLACRNTVRDRATRWLSCPNSQTWLDPGHFSRYVFLLTWMTTCLCGLWWTCWLTCFSEHGPWSCIVRCRCVIQHYACGECVTCSGSAPEDIATVSLHMKVTSWAVWVDLHRTTPMFARMLKLGSQRYTLSHFQQSSSSQVQFLPSELRLLKHLLRLETVLECHHSQFA